MNTFVRTEQYSYRFFPFLFLPLGRFILITFFVLFITVLSHPQKFLLTDIYAEQFSIDRIAQQVYFKDFYSDTVRRVDLKTLEVTKTGFLVSLPVFSNIRHLMLFGDNSLYDHGNKNTFYLYDFLTNSKLILTDTVAFPYGVEHLYSFSPRDSNFYHIAGSYFSLKDSTLLPLAKNIKLNLSTMDVFPQWSSDSSLVFLSGNGVIAEYFLKSKRLDTLVNFANSGNITGFAYNIEYNVLAYSIFEIIPQIYFRFKNSNSNSLVFSPTRDDPNSSCWGSPIGIRPLTWSPDNKRLAFGVYHYTNSLTGIYLYSLDSNRTYKATSCDDYGLKTTFHWANNDTLIYASQEDNYLYGMDLSSLITSIKNEKDVNIPTNFTIANYPNPFNGSTIITVTLPKNTTGVLYIYDILGRIVKKYQLDKKGENKYEINWNGLNEHNQNLSSGFYLGVLKSDDSKTQSTKTIKMIYLK